MLPRANIYDVATFVCLQDGQKRLNRQLRKRWRWSSSRWSSGIRYLLLQGWFYAVAFVVILILTFAVLSVVAPMGPGRFDVHARISLLTAWFVTLPLLCIDVRLNQLRGAIGRHARMRGVTLPQHEEEVARRRTQWNQLVASPMGRVMTVVMTNRLPAGIWLMMAPYAIILAPLVCFNLGGGIVEAAKFSVSLGLIATVLVRRRFEKQTAARFIDVSHQLACAECGYSLRSHLSSEEEKSGRIVGPSRCPECGTRWPLVPPPCFVLPLQTARALRWGQIPRLLPPRLADDHDEQNAGKSTLEQPSVEVPTACSPGTTFSTP